jgi:hypothetical protein
LCTLVLFIVFLDNVVYFTLHFGPFTQHVLDSNPFLVSISYVFFRCFESFLSLCNLIFLVGKSWFYIEKYKSNEKANLRENDEEADDVEASLGVIWSKNAFAMFEPEAI